MLNNSQIPLQVNSIYKSFKNKKVLEDISITVNSGEIYGLIGVNGIGKTTLIKIILDLLRADKGEAAFFGNSCLSPESRLNIAYLPEKFTPSPLLKGREFLELAMAYYGKKLDIEDAKNQAALLDLDPKVLDNRVGKYSKGMGQKLGLLSMFLSKAPLLVLDEPMSGLDPSARIRLKKMLKDYKEQGNTIFFSSHILADIEEICDRVAIIHSGKIIYEGKSSSFMEQYPEKNLESSFLKAIES